MNAFSNANSDANFSKWFTVRSTIIGGLSGLLFSLAQKQFRSAHRSLNFSPRVPGACGRRRFCALTRMQRRASCGSLYRYDDLPPPLAERHSLGQICTHSLWFPSAGIHLLTFIPHRRGRYPFVLTTSLFADGQQALQVRQCHQADLQAHLDRWLHRRSSCLSLSLCSRHRVPMAHACVYRWRVSDQRHHLERSVVCGDRRQRHGRGHAHRMWCAA